ncbi:hypothetical protein D9611_009393 [Ephemerocybe angulata]|uniref:Uncharacterized protein n=1 Tax=Ephemerocybe angulata TaxID=980116 RepID=A0A8H5BII1_9AGAR|nr:hypothetical protein D9611_009393 [Tulosesus angulatus]
MLRDFPYSPTPEDDARFSTLNVEETIDFSATACAAYIRAITHINRRSLFRRKPGPATLDDDASIRFEETRAQVVHAEQTEAKDSMVPPPLVGRGRLGDEGCSEEGGEAQRLVCEYQHRIL